MRDGRPNPDIWGNIITMSEIAIGIYEIVGSKKHGIEIPKEIAEEILPESVMTQAEPDGDNLCFSDPMTTAMVVNELINQELITDPETISKLDSLRQIDDNNYDSGFEPPYETVLDDELEL